MKWFTSLLYLKHFFCLSNYKGKNSEAESEYRRAVLLKPGEATAHMNLGAMLHFNGKLAEAERSYMTALRLKPDDSVTTANLHKLHNLMHKAKLQQHMNTGHGGGVSWYN